MAPLLKVENLTVSIRRGRRDYIAVDDVSFSVEPGGALGVVGESGCGKSVTCLSILRLAPPNIRVTGGEAFFEGRPLTKLPGRAFDKLRGNGFSMVFQDSVSGLNPLMRVGRQVAEALDIRDGGKRARGEAGRREVLGLLQRVRLDDAERCARSYPHELSGGQRQRVMIAMAIAAEPKLLIADEPTTALDASTRGDILGLLRELREKTGMALILISHDVGIVGGMCSDALVMYCGQAVEYGRSAELLTAPLHPYTAGLVRSASVACCRGGKLHSIEGVVASLEERNENRGCVFAERCDMRCGRSGERPLLAPARGGNPAGGTAAVGDAPRLCRCHRATVASGHCPVVSDKG